MWGLEPKQYLGLEAASAFHHNQISLGTTEYPGEIENNGYAIFFGGVGEAGTKYIMVYAVNIWNRFILLKTSKEAAVDMDPAVTTQ